MTEQKTEQENDVKRPTKKERIKAKIGAWWKSTVTEMVHPAEPSPPQESPPANTSVEPSPTPEKAGEKTTAHYREAAPEALKNDQLSEEVDLQEAAAMASTEAPTEEVEKSGDHKGETATRKPRKRRSEPRRKPQARQAKVDSGSDQSVVTKVDEGLQSKTGEEKESEQQSTRSVQSRPESERTKKDPTSENGKEESPDEQKGDQDQIKEDQVEEEQLKKEPKPITKLLINAEEPEECRLALLENGQLESIHVATSTRVQTKNNIYKARIVAIEPNLQAAFVDYGTEKNGFLPFSEIHPEYYKENVSDKIQELINQHQWKKLSITDVMERGREVLVQVVKEEVGKKGANMTTYLSLPGRCVVLMPGSDSKGISRKISGEERRTKLRDHMLSLKIPEGIGWIVRTASIDITKAALGRDVTYLLRLWEEVKKKGQDLDGVGLIYQDHDHVLRFLREHFDPDLQEILVDDKDAFEQVKGFIEMLPAKQRNVKCKLHRGARPIFNQYSIEDQIESIYQPKVNLPSGGSIVIDPTEALVAIDVNSGSTSKGRNFEESIFQANMEAAKELARQLRLRDLGGLIVVDFIDMRSKKHIREVERQVKSAMKRDKAKVDISRISKFGLMQISRQKLGAPIEAGNYRVCNHCNGRGVVRSVETLALFYLRRVHTAASRKLIRQVECHFPVDVAGYLLNNKRNELVELENRYETEVVIIAEPSFGPGDHEILFHKSEKGGTEKNKS